jgi:acetate CoA/acetoacetate CoA-transferase alpha subunit
MQSTAALPKAWAFMTPFPNSAVCDKEWCWRIAGTHSHSAGNSVRRAVIERSAALRSSISPEAAAELIPDGATLMIGGFMGVGSPNRVIDALVRRGIKGMVVIANDSARPGVGIGKLITAGAVARLVVSHIGTNLETQRRMLEGQLAVELVPQGTLVERIRAGGAGLGGVLTRTGLGTLCAEGKQIVEVNGEQFLLETPLRADVSIVASRSADYGGNLVYSLTARNFNPLMALAADLVIAEPNEIVPRGVLPPDGIHTPGVIVDHIVSRPLQ